jgi:hypothetical protein
VTPTASGLTADAKFWHDLPDNPTPEALLSRALEEAWFDYEVGRLSWAERARQDGKPDDTPPSKKIGLYRNALAKIMVELDMGTKRYRTVTFWQRVKRGETAIPMRQRADDVYKRIDHS